MAEIMFTVYAVLCAFHASPYHHHHLLPTGTSQHGEQNFALLTFSRSPAIKFLLNVKKNELLLSLQKHTKREKILANLMPRRTKENWEAPHLP